MLSWKDLDADGFFISAGAINVRDGSAQIAVVESIKIHESYNESIPPKYDNDIAILKLKTPLIFNDKVQPACLPEASFIPEGIAVASGWGRIDQTPTVTPLDLQVCIYYLFS